MWFLLKTEFCCRLNELIRMKWPVGCTVDLGTPCTFISGVNYVAGENVLFLGKGPQGSALKEMHYFE